MLKIINQGKMPNNMYTIRCDICGCEFMFEREDAQFVGNQKDGDYLRICCPTQECPVEFSVPLDDRGVFSGYGCVDFPRTS
jgi:hypothetical protein